MSSVECTSEIPCENEEIAVRAGAPGAGNGGHKWSSQEQTGTACQLLNNCSQSCDIFFSFAVKILNHHWKYQAMVLTVPFHIVILNYCRHSRNLLF